MQKIIIVLFFDKINIETYNLMGVPLDRFILLTAPYFSVINFDVERAKSVFKGGYQWVGLEN